MIFKVKINKRKLYCYIVKLLYGYIAILLNCYMVIWSYGYKLYIICPITDYRLPITDYRLPFTTYLLPLTSYLLPIADCQLPTFILYSVFSIQPFTHSIIHSSIIPRVLGTIIRRLACYCYIVRVTFYNS